MGKPTGFLEYARRNPTKRPVEERVRDWREVEHALPEEDLRTQAARCMDCGIPYCHAFGCPLAARVPEFNDLVYRGRWEQALELVHATNNFPEITGRVCPALCEAACTLSINAEAVTIREIELGLVERGWREGWIRPQPAARRSGKRVAVIGSGPAGLAAAQQLARQGHDVVVFEKADRVGGILRYGIPDFKLEKWVLDRRLEQLRAEGVVFETNVEAGVDISARYLRRSFDAICLTAGARLARDLTIPGRGFEGIHFAMDYLVQQNRRNAGDPIPPAEEIRAADKRVVVIGGGDTGSDCVGTACRQGARSVTQIELLPEPPKDRPPDDPWPTWPTVLRTSSSHEEGCDRLWSVLTKEFLGLGTHIRGLRCVRIVWSEPDAARHVESPAATGRRSFHEAPDSEFRLEADLVILALGFVHAEAGPLVRDLGIDLDPRGNLRVDEEFRTSASGVYAAGDAVAGASLVVRAIDQGRRMAEAVDRFLRSA